MYGPEILRRRILDLTLAGEPPFVLSDAFPHDWMPIPQTAHLRTWPGNIDRKTIKRCRWLEIESFHQVRQGLPVEADRLYEDPFQQILQVRNTIDRSTNTSLKEGGLYFLQETTFNSANRFSPSLDVYLHVQADFVDMLMALFDELSATGFGADTSAGRGQFEILGDFHSVPWLSEPVECPNGSIVLSTFQPGPDDPVLGLWESFTKHGKIGPDFGLADVRKRPLVLFRPGACFFSHPTKPWVGRAVPMDQLLPDETCGEIRRRHLEVVHLAFGLAIPAHFNPEDIPCPTM